MRESDLVVGETYFMVTYPEPSMVTPVVLTYRYLGKNLLDDEGEEDAQYYFRYLPAFKAEPTEAGFSWLESFPDSFSGWGEDVPTLFDARKLDGFCTIEGLLAELAKLRDRLREGS